MTCIRCPIRQFANINATHNIIVTQSNQFSYSMIERRISSVQVTLDKRGIKIDDRVALFSENSIEFITIFFALIRLGAIACPLSFRLPMDTVVSQLNHIGSSWFISDKDMKSSFKNMSVNALTFQSILKESVNYEQESINNDEVEYDLDQLATIIFSSGSTGQPKAIAHTFGNHYFNALGANENIPLNHADRWLLSLPIYHVGGLAILFRCVIAGATIVIDTVKDITVDFLITNGITHLSMVPTQLKRLLADPKGISGLRQLKCILVGGDVIDSDLIHDACARGLPIATTYGSTEMASQITATIVQDKRTLLNACGRVLNYRELSITKDQEILVKGQTLFKAFVENKEINYRQDDNEWYKTGDLGVLDDDGSLTVIGRKDNMFISGGENIYPEEIEASLNSIENIIISVVIPIPDDEFGYRPAAFMKITENIQLSLDDIVFNLQVLLPGFKIPVKFYAWPEDYHNPGFKLDRFYFRKLFAENRLEQV